MPQLSAYLSFDGNCADAMRFYERVLGGQLEAMIRYADAPPDAAMPTLSAEDAERIMYARLGLDEQTLMGSDATVGHPYPGKQGVALSLVFPTVSDAHRVFEQLGEGGSVTMPLQKTFWAEAYGALIDRFGTRWMISGGRSTH
ncbi:VOC family protein [Achromobacter seleniivolatilans]|uniref:VOC family protein n=1 Tax=Achromobacter seleniivolatilans TaxID=3047478 RepID=A0ABY9M4N7_9BURK|nr:VOC family protein [Achromobacter sp. R39]WMD21775.1 VOC family protein [Achromobacter sp. R39]